MPARLVGRGSACPKAHSPMAMVLLVPSVIDAMVVRL